MSSSGIARFPPETFIQILLHSGLRLDSHAVAMSVCRSWYRILFPVVYDTVYLSWNAGTFAGRILEEHLMLLDLPRTHVANLTRRPPVPIEGLRVTDYVHGLVVDNRIPRSFVDFHDVEVDAMQTAFPLLKKLKRFSWSLPWQFPRPRMFARLGESCPDMEHFSFNIPMKYGRFNDPAFRQFYSFSNLKHICIKDMELTPVPDTNGRLTPGLIDMILRSPELEHLELELAIQYFRPRPLEDTYVLIGALAPILEKNFEHLRVLSIKGTVDIDPECTISPDHDSLLKSFLHRHPNLHTLKLPWCMDMDVLASEPIPKLTSLHGLMPGLRCFVGPTFFVTVILQLDIAQNLERLGIIDTADEEESDLLTFVRTFPKLPNLQRLDFLSSYMLDCFSLSEMLECTPNIEELTLRWVDGDPATIVHSLASLPNLRYLNFGDNVMPHLASRTVKDVPWEHLANEVLALGNHCRGVRLLSIFPDEASRDPFDYETRWHFNRYPEGQFSVSFSQMPRLPTSRGALQLDPDYHWPAVDTVEEIHWKRFRQI